jgi:cell division protein FtsI/penicillin-binding protein 2
MRNLRTYLLLFLCCLLVRGATAQRRAGEALNSALQGTAAAGVVLDLDSGHLLGVTRPNLVAGLAAAPGSSLKPFFLAAALTKDQIDPETKLLCRRTFRIGRHELTCTHPFANSVFNAESALAYSCNSYFADLARRMTPQEAVSALHAYGFGDRPGVFPAESPGMIRTPENPDQLQLMVLGLENVAVTPIQLAEAYRRLAFELPRFPSIERGLRGSVDYGMAHNAALKEFSVKGKTGTASDPGQPWTHGWFAGLTSLGKTQIVIVIFVPRGNGGDAARLARSFLQTWRAESRTNR